MRRRVIGAAIALVALGMVTVGSPASTQASHWLNPALKMALDAENGKAPPRLPNGNFIPMVSGSLVHAATERGAAQQRATSAASLPNPTVGTAGCENAFTASGVPDNVRAN